MFDPFNHFDTRDYLFGTGYPFEDHLDPLNNRQDLFNDSIEPMGGEFVTSPVPYEPVPGTAWPGDPMDGIQGPVDCVNGNFDSGSELIKQDPVLDDSPGSCVQVIDSIGVRPGLPGELEEPLIAGVPEDRGPLGSEFEILEPAMELEKMLEDLGFQEKPFNRMKPGLDAVELQDELTDEGNEPLQHSWPYELLDEFEASIEEEEAPGTWSRKGQNLSNKTDYWTNVGIGEMEDEKGGEGTSERILGFSRPDLKIIDKSERTHDRQFKPKLWRPRRYSGIRKSQLSKGKKESEKREGDEDKAKVRKCPRKEELVALAECESCEYFKENRCTWEDEKEESQEEME